MQQKGGAHRQIRIVGARRMCGFRGPVGDGKIRGGQGRCGLPIGCLYMIRSVCRTETVCESGSRFVVSLGPFLL